MTTFYRAALGVVITLLCPLIIVGQEVERITNVSLPGWGVSTDIMDFEKHEETIYVLRNSPIYEGKVFATLDVETGALTDIPYAGNVGLTGGSSYNSSHLTSLEGMLFAQVGGNYSSNKALFRIDGERIERLLPDGIGVTSGLVSFQGRIYFIASTGYTMDEDIYNYSILRRASLYRTDGTAEGTVAIAELPHYAWGAWLLAGETALLIGLNNQTEYGATLHQYRPEAGLIDVDRSGRRTFTQGFGGRNGWLKYYQSVPTMPAVYADGYFYLTEAYTHNLVRVAEYSSSFTTITDPSGTLSSLPWNTATYLAATDDGVYLSAYDYNTSSFSLFQIMENGRVDFQTLRTGTAPYEANLEARDGLLYFVEYINGNESLLQYDPKAPLEAPILFYIDGWDFEYRIHATDDHLFVMPISGNGNRLYRYSFSTESLDWIDARLDGVTYTVMDEGFLFRGSNTEGQLFSYQPRYLPHDASSIRPFSSGNSSSPRRRGVQWLRPSSGDDIMYGYQNANLDQEYFAYNSESEVSTYIPIHMPGVTTESARIRFLSTGQVLISDVVDGATNFYVFVNGEVTPLLRAGTQRPLRIEEGTGRIHYRHHLYWQEFRNGNLTLHQFTIEGNQATDEVIATDLEGYWYSSKAGDKTIMYWQDENERNVERLLIIDDRTGEVLSDRVLADGHYRYFNGNDGGVWFDYYDGSSYSLRFYPTREEGYTQIVLDDRFITAGRQYNYALTDGLLFSIPGIDGTEWWMADRNTGALTELPDVNVSAEFDASYPYAFSTGSVVYYANTDGSRNTTLWRTDGSNEGTYRLADINPAMGIQSATMAGDSALYFAADGPDGIEPYVITLTGREEVRRVADINVGAGNSYPTGMVPTDNGLFVLARADDDAPRQVFLIKGLSTSTRATEPLLQVSLFPNPTADRLTVTVPEEYTLERIELFDQLGRRANTNFTPTGQRAEVDVSSLPSGSYLLLTHFADGQRGYGRVTVSR